MRAKLFGLIVVSLLVISLVPANTSASYKLGISGEDFFTAIPYQGGNETGHVRMSLSDTSEGPLVITIQSEGDLAQWLTFTGNTTFTLYPDEEFAVFYEINFPPLSPGKYEGMISGTGVPESNPDANVVSGAAIRIVLDVPTNIQIYNFQNQLPGGFVDTDWLNWGTGWTTDFDIYNGAAANFSGYCNLTLLDGTTVIEYENFPVINLTSNGTLHLQRIWTSVLDLGETYTVRATLYDDLNLTKDDEAMPIEVLSPAKIISVHHLPDPVFSTDTVNVYAELASSDSTVELHWRLTGGTETTASMTYSSATGEFIASIPPQTADAVVEYWVTSVNGILSDRSPSTGEYSYHVFSPDIPDLVIEEASIDYSPIDLRTTRMNATNYTNIIINVRNDGLGDASDVLVRITHEGTVIFEEVIDQLGGRSSDAVSFHWEPATEGDYTLQYSVDPDNTVVELNDNNNDFSETITIYPPLPGAPVDEPTNILPFVAIPISLLFLLLLLLLLMKRKARINVMVLKAKPYTSAKDGETRYRYNCGYAEDAALGNTAPTEMKAEKGDILLVEPTGLKERADGRIVWQSAKVIKLKPDIDQPDSAQDILKKIKKKDKK